MEVGHQRARGEDEIDPGGFEIAGEFGVPTLCRLAELQHVAEHGEPPSARRERSYLGERYDCRANGHRARVVTLIDQLAETARNRNAVAHAPARTRRNRAERAGCMLDRCAGGADTGQRGHTVQRPVPARERDLVIELGAVDRSGHGAAGGGGLPCEEPRIRARVLTERHDVSRACAARGGGQPIEMVVVPVQHGRAARLETFENLGLGVGDSVEAGEEFGVSRGDCGDQHGMRTGQTGERADLAGMIHPDLEHAVGGALRQTSEAERHADMVVEIACAGERGAAACERTRKHLLGSGLADAASDRNDVGRAPLTDPARPGCADPRRYPPQAAAARPRLALRVDGLPSPLPPHGRTRPARSRGRHGWGRRARRTDRPASTLRLSIDTPVALQGSGARPPVAATASAEVHSGTL